MEKERILKNGFRCRKQRDVLECPGVEKEPSCQEDCNAGGLHWNRCFRPLLVFYGHRNIHIVPASIMTWYCVIVCQESRLANEKYAPDIKAR